MKKSSIIKDLVNESISLETTLTRLKLILSDFDKNDIISWVDNELTGYCNKDNVIFPDYRILQPINAYVICDGIGHGLYFQNKKISMPYLFNDYKNQNIYIPDSIKALENSKNGVSFKMPIEHDILIKYVKIPLSTVIKEAYLDLGDAKVITDIILSSVKKKTLDILILLEKEFGNLDDYDLDINTKTPEVIEEINEKIKNIIEVSTMNVIYNNGGTNQNNLANGNAVINAKQNSDIKELIELCNQVLSTIRQDETQLTSEQKQEVEECIEVITNEIQSAAPKKSLLKTAGNALKNIFNPMDKGLKFVITATQIYNLILKLISVEN